MWEEENESIEFIIGVVEVLYRVDIALSEGIMVGQCSALQLFIILNYRRRGMSGVRGIAKYR